MVELDESFKPEIIPGLVLSVRESTFIQQKELLRSGRHSSKLDRRSPIVPPRLEITYDVIAENSNLVRTEQNKLTSWLKKSATTNDVAA